MEESYSQQDVRGCVDAPKVVAVDVLNGSCSSPDRQMSRTAGATLQSGVAARTRSLSNGCFGMVEQR